MEFTVSTSQLKTCLDKVGHGIAKGSPHPVLMNVKIEKIGKELTFTGFDLSLSVTARMTISTEDLFEEDITFTLPHKQLIELIKNFKSDDTTFSIDNTDSDNEDSDSNNIYCTIKSGRAKCHLIGLNADEYPEIPQLSEEQRIVNINKVDLINAIEFCLPATSSDETKQILQCIHVSETPEKLEFASTDGHRLTRLFFPLNNILSLDDLDEIEPEGDTEDEDDIESEEDIENEDDTEDDADEDDQKESKIDRVDFDLKNTTLKVLLTLLKQGSFDDLSLDIPIILTPSFTKFCLDDTVIIGRAMEGVYPNYPTLISDKFTRYLTVNISELNDSLKLIASVSSSKKNACIKMRIDPSEDVVKILYENKGIGDVEDSVKIIEYKEDLPDDQDSIVYEVDFNNFYLQQYINLFDKQNFEENNITFCLNSCTQAVILNKENYLYLIMPVQPRY